MTKRRLMLDYSIKGIYPLVPLINTTTPDTYYLKGQRTAYPTAVLDFDGNERASVHFRNSDLNLLHILLQQLQRKDLSPEVRKAATNAFFATIDRRRAGWEKQVAEINLELGALRRAMAEQQKLWESQPKKFTNEEQDKGLDDDAKRMLVQVEKWTKQEQLYSEYITTLQNLLSLTPETFVPQRTIIEAVIKKNSMGDHNSIHQLQNYVVGLSPAGLILKSDGSLDIKRTFIHVNYFSLLHELSVRNNVQQRVSNRPVDIIATRISASQFEALPETDISDDVIWINAGRGKEALLLSKTDTNGELSIRYQPITNLTQDEDGRIRFSSMPWQAELPLKLFEDPRAGDSNERSRSVVE